MREARSRSCRRDRSSGLVSRLRLLPVASGSGATRPVGVTSDGDAEGGSRRAEGEDRRADFATSTPDANAPGNSIRHHRDRTPGSRLGPSPQKVALETKPYDRPRRYARPRTPRNPSPNPAGPRGSADPRRHRLRHPCIEEGEPGRGPGETAAGRRLWSANAFAEPSEVQRHGEANGSPRSRPRAPGFLHVSWFPWSRRRRKPVGRQFTRQRTHDPRHRPQSAHSDANTEASRTAVQGAEPDRRGVTPSSGKRDGIKSPRAQRPRSDLT